MSLFSGDSEVTFLRDLVKSLQDQLAAKDKIIAEMAVPLSNARIAYAERSIGREREKQQAPPPPMRHSAGAIRHRREDRPAASARVGAPTAGEMETAKRSAAEVEASFTES